MIFACYSAQTIQRQSFLSTKPFVDLCLKITQQQMTNVENLAAYPLVYDSEFCTIYDMRRDVSHTAFAFWKGFFKLDNPVFLKDMKYSVDFIREKRIKVMISDHTNLKVVTPEVLTWIHKNWYAPAAKYGLKAEAVLEAESVFAKLTLEKMIESKKLSNIMALKFSSFEEARGFSEEFAKKMWEISMPIEEK